jgi:hypothetical protein
VCVEYRRANEIDDEYPWRSLEICIISDIARIFGLLSAAPSICCRISSLVAVCLD